MALEELSSRIGSFPGINKTRNKFIPKKSRSSLKSSLSREGVVFRGPWYSPPSDTNTMSQTAEIGATHLTKANHLALVPDQKRRAPEAWSEAGKRGILGRRASERAREPARERSS